VFFAHVTKGMEYLNYLCSQKELRGTARMKADCVGVTTEEESVTLLIESFTIIQNIFLCLLLPVELCAHVLLEIKTFC
jgi:hypothetical protein